MIPSIVGHFAAGPSAGGLGTKRLIVGAARRQSARFQHFRRLRLGFEKLEPRQMLSATAGTGARQMEFLNRGIVAVYQGSGNDYISWRLLGTDPSDISFNLYRQLDAGAAVKLNNQPLTQTTDFRDLGVGNSQSRTYFVRPVIGGIEQVASETFTLPANTPNQQYLSIPLQPPPGGTTPDGVAYTYNANDGSVGDVDGDGQYEIFLKWDPTNSKDNSQSGYTGDTFLDCYKLDGTRLWRIDLGINVRSGAHYEPFIVYDLDGDGKAEVACRTAPGTIDGQGNYVILPGDDPHADYRNSSGYILTGPQYLTIFNGQTGAAMATTAFLPDRVNINQWGDTYGNRGDRFLMAVAYLDGQRPSLVVGRGIFPGQSSGVDVRNEVTAWNWRNEQLNMLWWFKAADNLNGNTNSTYVGQGTYDMIPADVDGDGRDEIIYGGMAIDDNGTPLYTTTLGHGDAMHVSDMDPTRPGLEVFMPHETPSQYGAYGGELRDARTGQLLAAIDGHNSDVGRGVAFDVDPRYLGYEMWTSSDGNMYNVNGQAISVRPSDYNFGVWWDADPLRELLDSTHIDKWNWNTASLNRLLTGSGISSNNGTKSTPVLSADIFGDWREEVIWRASDNLSLRIYTTTIPATNRMYTLMHDTQYREAIAWQNVGYNQPPNPSFYVGDGMSTPPIPDIYLVQYTGLGAGNGSLVASFATGASPVGIGSAASFLNARIPTSAFVSSSVVAQTIPMAGEETSPNRLSISLGLPLTTGGQVFEPPKRWAPGLVDQDSLSIGPRRADRKDHRPDKLLANTDEFFAAWP
jgi:Rhamnogalacturonan I lyases beta-sheet domain